MRNFKDIILEKLKVTKNTAVKPELLDYNLVSCTMEFFFKWLMVLDQDKPLTQADFEDFEVFEDDYLRDEFNTYENLFNYECPCRRRKEYRCGKSGIVACAGWKKSCTDRL